MFATFASLAFLIALDFALCATLYSNYRAIRDRAIGFASAMLLCESVRQCANTAYVAIPGVIPLLLISGAANFAAASFLLASVAAWRGVAIRPRWYVLAAAAHAIAVVFAFIVQSPMWAAWLMGTVPLIAVHAVTAALAARARPGDQLGRSWLLGLLTALIALRLAAPFVVGSEALYSIDYFLDAISIILIGGMLWIASVERLALQSRDAGDAARDAEELLRAILDAAYDAIVTCDEGGKIVSWNRQAEKTFGWQDGVVIGQRIDQVLPGIHPGLWDNAPDATGDRRRTEIRTQRRDGLLVDAEVAAFSVERRGARMLVAVIRNITAEREAEEERRAIENQMRHVQRLDSLGVLAGGIAHDFNNILAAIMSFSDIGLRELRENGAPRECFEEILTASSQGSNLTKQILAYAGKSSPSAIRLDPAQTVHHLLPLLKTVVQHKAAITIEVPEEPLRILADETQLRQVLINLVKNASDAMGDKGGTVWIAVDAFRAGRSFLNECLNGHQLEEGEFVRIRVSDTGCGLTEPEISKIFDPFYTTKPAGRGLGMATVSAIVRAHHGAIHVESARGSGTTITVLFPPAADTPGTQSAGDSSEFASAFAAPISRPATVLIVDDEDNIRKAIGMILERAGFSVLHAQDGAACLEILEKNDGDVQIVLLDCNMPRMSGQEALEHILERRKGFPVLMSSGSQAASDIPDGLPNVGFIQKPYRAQELVEKICAMIGIAKPGAALN